MRRSLLQWLRRQHPDAGPEVWMEAEMVDEECCDCPFRCPDCDQELIPYHDSWHCDFCGVVW